MLPYLIMLGCTLVFAGYWQLVLGDRLVGQLSLLTSAGKQYTLNTMRILPFLVFLPMFLINGFMSYVGNDYINYVGMFEQINQGTLKTDRAFQWINQIVGHFNWEFQTVYIICCIVGYSILLKCIYDYSDNMAISYLFYFCMGFFFLLGMNQLRQFVALTLVMFAYRYIPQGKFVKYAALVLVAYLFHFSAIVMLPAYFILRLRFKASYYLIGMMLLLPFNFFYNKLIRFLFKTFRPRYIGSSYVEKTFKLDMIYILGIFITVLLIFMYYDWLNKSKPINTTFVNGIFIAALIYTLCGWLPEYYRFAYYFYLPAIFLIPNILSLEKSHFLRVILLSGVTGFYFFIYTMRMANGWGVLPYVSIFTR